MKLRMKVLVGLMAITNCCLGVVIVGHEMLGVTLNVWWNWGDFLLKVLIGYTLAYPLVKAVEIRSRILRDRRALQRLGYRSH